MGRNGNLFIQQCVCGKTATSRPGLTLHQRRCAAAQEAVRTGQPSTLALASGPREKYDGAVGEFVTLADYACSDTAAALRDGNKSAARRARKALLEIRVKVLPLRKALLAVLRK